jgi:hydrogenase nickel incorporation protein HypA/HybF
MHELSIAMSILDCAAEEAMRRGADEVVSVHLKLGPLSGVVREALLSAYDLAREQSESCLQSSRLVIQEVPITVYCPACDAVREPPSIQ